MPNLRVVLLTGDAPQHCRVARALAKTGLLDAIVIDEGVPRTWIERLRAGRRRFGAVQLVQRIAWRTMRKALGRSAAERAAITAILGEARMPSDVPVYRVSGVNSRPTRELLTDLAPDILCVYGTSIVKDPTLSIAKSTALNMHTGISPRYRGADCAFWPLHENEPGWLGATVHECTSAIDGGAIFGTAHAVLESSDGVAAVFARCVAVGADLYASVLQQVVDGTATGRPQDLSDGREFRASMRTWRAELRVERAIAKGLVRDFVAGRQLAARPRSGDD